MRPIFRQSARNGISRPRTIRTRLIGVAIALVIPGWLGMAAAIFGYYHHERERIAESTIATTRALLAALDRDLMGTITAAQVMAASPLLEAGDFAAFHREARKLLPLVLGSTFVLADASGRQIVNTVRPFGEPLPLRGRPENARKVFETGMPSISDVFVGNVSKRPLISIEVPVRRGGKVEYSLAVGVLPERLNELLIQQVLPENWVAAILDRSGVVVARTRESERYAGQTATPALIDALKRASSGMVETSTMEGEASFAVFSRSDLSNWTVVIGIPAAELSMVFTPSLVIGGVFAFLLLAAGLALAAYQSAQIARAVRDLIPPALALGRGEVPNVPRLRVREADDVAQALDRAFEILRSRTIERDSAERKKSEADTVARVMDEFVSTVSHELRTPLTSIAGSLGLLAGGATGTLPPAALRLVSIAHANARRLVRLINDILDIGKIESGKMTFNFTAVDLHPTVEQAVEANRAFADAHGVDIRLDSVAQGCVVRADADRLIQVFTNLLSNAIKYSPKGAEVAVTIERREGAARVVVRDHGPGISDAFKERIFEKFAQADTADAQQKGGTGLGLNIVRTIIAHHGGTVGFAGAPGGGTMFHVEIALWDAGAGVPLSPADDACAAQDRQPLKTPA